MTTPTTAREHLLALVEPTPAGDTTLDLAHEVAERGGSVHLLLMITPRVRDDIAAFAKGADLTIGEAEAIAIDRLSSVCEEQVGATTATTTILHAFDSRELSRFLTSDTTAIAIPEHLASRRTVRFLSASSGLPVHVAARRAA